MVNMDESGDDEARGEEIRAFMGASTVSYQAALNAAIVKAVDQVGTGKYWEVTRKAVRGDNPRIGEYRVWITESSP